MDEVVRDAVFGNAGTLICFRMGAADAEFLENEFMPSFTPEDLVNLSKYNIALKLMINGITSRAFSAQTLPPIEVPGESERDTIIRISRERYGKSRQDTEERILQWSGMGERKEEFVSPREVKSRYQAICSRCGKSTELNFKPDGQRPVYCEECFSKVMKERDRRREISPPPIRSKPRSEVNLTSLRKTLKDITRPADSPYGIMEEGEEITF